MANIRDLKKNINNVLGDIIGVAQLWELNNPTKETEKLEAIIDDVITVFDDLIVKVNLKDVENKKQHFKAISQELEEKGRKLIETINKL